MSRVLYPRLPVPHPEDEKSCNWGTSPSPLPAGGTQRPGHHSGEEGGARMPAPLSPSGVGNLPVGVKWKGASPWGCNMIDSPLCSYGKPEDTYHYFFNCNKYAIQKNELFNSIFRMKNLCVRPPLDPPLVNNATSLQIPWNSLIE